MPTDNQDKRAWITRVLAVHLPAGSSGSAEFDRALAAWRQALLAVDGQIAGLQRLLRTAPDDELTEIAEFGLNAMTGNFKVKLQSALMEAQSGNDKARQIAARLAGAFRDHLNSDARVAACDANPFGVAMSIRQTLVPPLTSLLSALAD